MIGKDPITLENIDPKEWLKESNDNILLIFDKKSKGLQLSNPDSKKNLNIPDIIYCLKRSMLQTPSIKNIYLKCILANHQLMNKETYSSKTAFFHIGHFLNKTLLINLQDLSPKLLNKNNIFKIDLESGEIADFVNKELLMLSIIGLAKKPSMKIPKSATKEERETLKETHKSQAKLDKTNMPHNKEVYFETILAKALTDYSFQWDAPVNLYLREGDSYFQNDIFKQYYKRYGETVVDAERAIKSKVEDLDRAFLKAAPRNENPNSVFYRGMSRPFANLTNVGDTETIQNFISVSSAFNIALRFSGVPRGTKCCLYKIIVDKGIPLIDMVTTTKYKHEKEVLLPRNLVFTYIHTEFINWPLFAPKHYIPIGVLKVTLANPDQFKLTTGCKKFIVGKLIPFNPAYISMPDIKKQRKEDFPIAKDENGKPINIDAEVKDDVQNHTVPLVGKRCPKGYKFNKTIKLCEFFDPNKPKEKKVKTEKKEKPKKPKKKKKEKPKTEKKVKPDEKDTKGMSRCSNGTRRSKITGNCEPTNKN